MIIENLFSIIKEMLFYVLNPEPHRVFRNAENYRYQNIERYKDLNIYANLVCCIGNR